MMALVVQRIVVMKQQIVVRLLLLPVHFVEMEQYKHQTAADSMNNVNGRDRRLVFDVQTHVCVVVDI